MATIFLPKLTIVLLLLLEWFPTKAFQIHRTAKQESSNCSLDVWFNDNVCDDENNVASCRFDGEDCCHSNSDFTFCTDCQCLGNITEVSEPTSNCPSSSLVGDNVCDDPLNNLDCNFDGGDCCGLRVSYDFCTNCTCSNPDFFSNVGLKCAKPDSFNNLICDDENNVAECFYDGFDCCDTKSNYTNCINCTCFFVDHGLRCSSLGKYADGKCHDGNNHPWCNYDGGDCCVPNVSPVHCQNPENLAAHQN